MLFGLVISQSLFSDRDRCCIDCLWVWDMECLLWVQSWCREIRIYIPPFKLTKGTPFLTLTGEKWGVFHELKVCFTLYLCSCYAVCGIVLLYHDWQWYKETILCIDGLVQDCSNSSAVAMELLQSCAKSSTCFWNPSGLMLIRHPPDTSESLLLALCEGNPPVTKRYPHKCLSLDVSFVAPLNSLLNKLFSCQWLTMPWCSSDVFVWCLANRDHFVYAPSEWGTLLHWNVISHWLGADTTWSLARYQDNRTTNVQLDNEHRAYSRFAPSQWETALLYNAISHWLGANLESAMWAYLQKSGGQIQLSFPLSSMIFWGPSQ